MTPTMRKPAMPLLHLDGHPVEVFEIEWESAPIEYLRSYRATLPDGGWRFIDDAGHVHRWARFDRGAHSDPAALPTLTGSSRHIPCDGGSGCAGCEGVDVPVWSCTLCDQVVEPGFVPDDEARTTGLPIETGPATARLVVDGAQLDADRRYAGKVTMPRGGTWSGPVDVETTSTSTRATVRTSTRSTLRMAIVTTTPDVVPAPPTVRQAARALLAALDDAQTADDTARAARDALAAALDPT